MYKLLFRKEDEYDSLIELLYDEELNGYVLFINNVEGAVVTYEDICKMQEGILRQERYFEE